MMTTIHAVVHGRRIDVPAPADIPDGTPVVLQLVSPSEKVGLDESEWDDTPEGIAKWLKWLDSLEPLIFESQELTELEADRKARKLWELQHFADHGDQLAKDWS